MIFWNDMNFAGDYKLATIFSLFLSSGHEISWFNHHDGFLQGVVPASPTEPDNSYKKIKDY